MKVFYSLIAVIQIIGLVYGQESDCPVVTPCECFGNTAQIRCVGDTINELKISPDQLNKLGKAVSGEWDLLYIENTNISELSNSLFSNASFERIFIVGNKHLKTISVDVFGNEGNKAKKSITKDVVIKHNEQLNITDFGFLSPFKDTLVNLELYNNNIQHIKENSFKSFESLERIFLDHQISTVNGTIQSMTIDVNAFNDLRNLRVLTLDGNNIASINNNSIDLSNTVIPKEQELIIFLNNSHLDNTVLSKKIITMPNATEGPIMVYLNNNAFHTLHDGLIDTIASRGYVFIDTKSLNCSCNDVLNIVDILKNKSNSIQTLNHRHDCLSGVPEKTVQIINCTKSHTL